MRLKIVFNTTRPSLLPSPNLPPLPPYPFPSDHIPFPPLFLPLEVEPFKSGWGEL